MNFIKIQLIVILTGISCIVDTELACGQWIRNAGPMNEGTGCYTATKAVSSDQGVWIGGPRCCKDRPYGSDTVSSFIDSRLLNAQDVLLEYRLSDSVLFTKALSCDSVCFTSQKVSHDFWRCLDLFRKKLKTADPGDLTIPAKVLYFFLIRPVQDFVSGKRRLIIIPDQAFSDIPFEALIRVDRSTKPTLLPIPYLIGDFEVVYAFNRGSPDLNQNGGIACDTGPVTVVPQTFIGFSPVFSGQSGLDSLPASKAEIEIIGDLFQQQGWTSWMVTEQVSLEEYFKTLARYGRIVHLATHYIPGDPDQGAPGYLFWDYDPAKGNISKSKGILTLNEIYEMDLHADLVVLNACAPFREMDDKPDNPVSPARLFLKAGAKNTISTLWNICDRVAETFMIDFYRCILAGRSFSESLRDVKLRLISKPATSLPTIWAPYVLTCR